MHLSKANKKIVNDIEHDYHKFYVGLVVINTDGEVLLGKRREDGIWTGPGGSSEGSETPEETLKREAFEEAQLEIYNYCLTPLPTLTAADGKPVFCYLYAPVWEIDCQRHLDPTKKAKRVNLNVNLDPDREVPEWKWFGQDEIPQKLTEDSNRHQAVMNGLMSYKGLVLKSQQQDLVNILKGGAGSGQKGHTTDTGVGQKTKVRKEKSPLREQYVKLAESFLKWRNYSLQNPEDEQAAKLAETFRVKTKAYRDKHFKKAEKLAKLLEAINE